MCLPPPNHVPSTAAPGAAGWMGYAWRPGQSLEALLDDPPAAGALGVGSVVGAVAIGYACFFAVCWLWFARLRPAWDRWGLRSEIKLYGRV